jgi:hypothetical protein
VAEARENEQLTEEITRTLEVVEPPTEDGERKRPQKRVEEKVRERREKE